MRKIGFDFDGVIAEKVSFDGDLKKHRNNLLNAKPLLNPYRIKRSDDKIYIITGRYTEHYFPTTKWLNKHYPKFDLNNLYFVNQLEFKNDYCNRSHSNYLRFILHISRMKLKMIAKLDIDIYFEDNEIIIRYLRFFIGKKCKIIDIKDVETTEFKKWIKEVDKNIEVTKLKDVKVKDINHLRFLKELYR